MDAIKLFSRLDKDFIKKGMTDDWTMSINGILDYVTDNFKKRSMGLFTDNTNEINKVYTAVFPSKEIMNTIIFQGYEDVLLFLHHPASWDINKSPEAFQPIDKNLLKKFKSRKISIYNLHVPLDNFNPYSTSNTLAKALKIKVSKPFGEYHGGLAGVFGTTEIKNLEDLSKKFKQLIGHRVGFYNYGDINIFKSRVAIVAGGGNDLSILKELNEANVKTLITGISVNNSHSKKAHEYAEYHKINILGGTHYSTEKFACIEMCKYFKKLGLSAEFIEDKPCLEDL